jgi:hypothetical protein
MIYLILYKVFQSLKNSKKLLKWISRCLIPVLTKKCFIMRIVSSVHSLKTHIDDDKCFPEFSYNYGFSVCIKTCLFNRKYYTDLKNHIVAAV